VFDFKPLNTLIDSIWNLLLPPRCIACDENVSGIFCTGCALSLIPAVPHTTLIIDPIQPGAWHQCLAPLAYGGQLSVAVHRLKYKNKTHVALPLAALLAAFVRQPNGPSIAAELIVPVPLHRRRLRQRGYNQAALLAHHLGRMLSLPVNYDALQRRRDTPSQMEQSSRAARQKNVADAFVVQSSGLSERRVLVVDDIFTTGATVAACIAALRLARVQSVQVLTVAKSMP
jgi:ComF family protein